MHILFILGLLTMLSLFIYFIYFYKENQIEKLTTFIGDGAIDNSQKYDTIFDDVVYYKNDQDYADNYKTGYEKCIKDCIGNCVEFGLTGDATCFTFN